MRRTHLVLAMALGLGGSFTFAMPYPSNVVISGGTSVSFILNEPADVLTYSINGGSPVALDGTTKGTKTFALGVATDNFTVNVQKSDGVGYSIPTGGTQAATANGLSQPTALGGTRLISTDTDVLNRFNSPRGVAVSNNPNSANFGTTYLSNSAAGTTTGVVRSVGDGLYAVHADQSDAYGYGNTAKNVTPVFDTTASGNSSPFRTTVGPNGDLYVADFSDVHGGAWQLNQAMTADNQLLAIVGGPSAVPAGQNHGSTTAVYAEGSLATGDLVLYTVDEDLTFGQFGGSGAGKNNLWKYVIGSTPNFSGNPTRVNTSQVLLSAATSDMTRGADGKFYLAQNRSAGAETGIVVLDSSGNTLFDSLSASRTLLGNPTAADIFRNVLAMDVSPDQNWMAIMLNSSDVAVIPLINGIPDIANRRVVDSANPDIASGRDIAFDSANNIHYVSSGQALYRVLSPGGVGNYELSYNGTSGAFTFAAVPEPTALAGLLGATTLLLRRRRSVR